MKISTYIVSENGDWLSDAGSDLHEMIGDPQPDFDAGEFAVRNLGCIKVETVGGTLVEIGVHPANVRPGALRAVAEWVAASGYPIYKLRHLAALRWESEVVTNAEQAARRLIELCSPVPSIEASSSERYAVLRQDCARVMADEHHPFRPLLQKWRVSFGNFDETVIPFAARQGLLSRLMIASVDRRRPDPTFKFVGDGFFFFGHDFPYRAIGTKVRDLPDREYGDWVSRFYAEVALAHQPRYDRVDAAIRESRRGPRTRYERLLLPWRAGSGEVLVTLSSRVPETAEGAEAALPETAAGARSESRKVRKSR